MNNKTILPLQNKCKQFNFYSDNQNQLKQLLKTDDYSNHISKICEINNDKESYRYLENLFQNLLKIQKRKNVQQLSLYFIEREYINSQTTKLISKELLKLKNMKILGLSFMFNSIYQNDLKVQQILKCFEYTNHLKSLSLQIEQSSKIGDSGLNNIVNSLKYLVDLRSFSLVIKEYNNITNKGIKYLNDITSYLPNLYQIKININGIFDPETVFNFILRISNLKKLNDMEAKFYDMPQLFEIIYSKYQDQNNNTKKVIKRFKYTGLKQYESLDQQSFTDLIQNCDNLEVLQTNWNLNIFLNRQILKKKQLRELSITLFKYQCRFGIVSIIKNISNLEYLEKLEINLFLEFSFEDLEQYLNDCYKKLNLKEFKLNCEFGQYCNFRQNIYSFMLTPIQYLNQLTRLDLNTFIYDKQTQLLNFDQVFKNLPNLRILKLSQNRYDCNPFKKEQGYILSKALLNLVNLNELDLYFSVSQTEAQNIQEIFCNNLIQLKQLRKINLSRPFPWYYIKNPQKNFYRKYLRLVEYVKSR